MDATISNKKLKYSIINPWINFLKTRELSPERNLRPVLNGFRITCFSDIIIKINTVVNNK